VNPRASYEVEAVRRTLVMPAPTCWYCNEPATERCTEKVAEPWITFPGLLEPYALIQDAVDQNWYMVEAVERVALPTEPTGRPWLSEEVWHVTLLRREGKTTRILRPLLPVLELRNAACDRPTCDNHTRDLGDGEHFRCKRHWADEQIELMPHELELAAQWRGLLETSVQYKKKETRK
jgi:hypothetical protein